MNYDQTIAYLESLMPTDTHPGLERIDLFLYEHGSPQDKYASIHVAGTNGKGSTVALLDSVLREAGMRVGRFVGPHLLSWNERLHVDGRPISDESFAALASDVRLKSEDFAKRHPDHGRLTWFEFLTAMAFFYFQREAVDIAVVETGLGGRWDATNTIHQPIATVITTIDLDHTHILGTTIEQIAQEKAGIIKAGVPVITATAGSALTVVETVAQFVGAPVIQIEAPDAVPIEIYSQLADAMYVSNLHGLYQRQNMHIAFVTLVQCVTSEKLPGRVLKAMPNGFAKVFWPGRMQYIWDLDAVLDGAHNVAGAKALRATLDDMYPERPRVFVLSFFKNKNVEDFLQVLLRPEDKAYAAEARTHREVFPSASITASACSKCADARKFPSISQAFDAAIKGSAADELIVCTGSFSTVKECMQALGWKNVDACLQSTHKYSDVRSAEIETSDPAETTAESVPSSSGEVTYNLKGTVRNQSLPITGTRVLLYDHWTTSKGLVKHYLTEQTTNAKGEFSFEVRLGTYAIEVVPNPDTRFARQPIENIKIYNNYDQPITLKTGCLLSGTVRTALGDIERDVEILVFGFERTCLETSVRNDENGRYTMTLPKGKYQITCRHAGGETLPFVSPVLETLEIDSDIKRDIKLPGYVRLTGVVKDYQVRPVSNARAIVTPANPPDELLLPAATWTAECLTSEYGQFECDVVPGSYDIRIAAPDEAHLAGRKVSGLLVEQARTRNYDLEKGYQIFGFVSYNGEPVADALVFATGGKVDANCQSDEEGYFVLTLPSGLYEINVCPQPDSLARLPFRVLAPWTTTLSLSKDTELNVELEEGIPLTGKVVDKSHQGRPGVHLAIYRANVDESKFTEGSTAIAFALSGERGSYEFRVAPGKYWLVINGQMATARMFDVSDDNDAESNVLWDSSCLIHFQVVSEFDEPVPKCQISFERYGTRRNNGDSDLHDKLVSMTDDDGICRLALEAGIYSFYFDPPEHGSYEPKQIRQLSLNSDVSRKVKLSLKTSPKTSRTSN
jgi:dihydrofolate synthase/folylpolyglutamate synthase